MYSRLLVSSNKLCMCSLVQTRTKHSSKVTKKGKVMKAAKSNANDATNEKVRRHLTGPLLSANE